LGRLQLIWGCVLLWKELSVSHAVTCRMQQKQCTSA
jgi:hypothetical protein